MVAHHPRGYLQLNYGLIAGARIDHRKRSSLECSASPNLIANSIHKIIPQKTHPKILIEFYSYRYFPIPPSDICRYLSRKFVGFWRPTGGSGALWSAWGGSAHRMLFSAKYLKIYQKAAGLYILQHVYYVVVYMYIMIFIHNHIIYINIYRD